MTIDDFVADILARCAVPPDPPVDLVHVARTLGVHEITEAPLVEDGRLEHTPHYVKVLLQRGAGYHRQRFTLAHELGHLVLTDPEAYVVARRYRPSADQEERFCDAFAAALLLPRDWVTSRFADAPTALHVVHTMSELAHVSLAASLIRLNEVLGWQRTLLRWRRLGDGHWRLVSATGVPYRLQGCVRSAPETAARLEALTGQLRAAARGDGERGRPVGVPLLIDGRRRVVSAEVACMGASVMALAELPVR